MRKLQKLVRPGQLHVSMFFIFLPCLLVSLPYFCIISCYMLLFSPIQLPILMFLLSLFLPGHHTLFYTQASWNNGVTWEFRSWVFQPRLHLNYLTLNIFLEHGYIWIPSDSTFLLMETHGCESDWLLSTLPYLLILPREAGLAPWPQMQVSRMSLLFHMQKVFISLLCT